MSKHPVFVDGYAGTNEDLAKDICNMSYYRIKEFMKKFANDIIDQSMDEAAGHPKLSQNLEIIARELLSTETTIGYIFNSDPHSLTKQGKSYYVEGYSDSLDQLAISVGNMSYDMVADFIGNIADYFKIKAQTLEKKPLIGFEISSDLSSAAISLTNAQELINNTWNNYCKDQTEKIDRTTK